MQRWQFDVEQFRKNWEQPVEVAKAELPQTLAKVEPADIEQIRKNWDQAVEVPKTQLPRKFARVEPPSDPFPEAHGLLGRVRGYAQADLGKHEATLAPFFAETEELISKLEKASPADRKPLRLELDRVLGDLEDMLALFSGVGR